MNLFHRLIARLHPCIPLYALPVPLAKTTGFTLGSADPKADDHLKCVELEATWDGEAVTLFVDNEMIIGVRYDLRLSFDVLKALLFRSSQKSFGCFPEPMLDRSPAYVAKLGQNVLTISGYTGSIGLWTEALRARIHAPRIDPIAAMYENASGYSGHWKVANPENIARGLLEVYIRHGADETFLGRSLLLESFDLDLVLICTDSIRCLKLLAKGQEIGEISLGEFSLASEEGWYTQGAVLGSKDLYVLWHTSIVDFRNAFGYKLVKS